MKIIRTICAGSIAVSLMFGAAASAGAAEPMYSSDGRALIEASTLAGTGEYDEMNGVAQEASFRHPTSVTVLPDGSILVSDTGNHRIRLIKNDAVSVFAGTEVSILLDEAMQPMGAYADGDKEFSFFNEPSGLAVDSAGHVYVADTNNHAVRKISQDGVVTTVAGSGVLGAADGEGKTASFYAPSDVAVAKDGTLYVADTLNHAIRKIDSSGKVTTLNARSSRSVEAFPGVVEAAGDFKDGPLTEARFNEPSGLTLDAKGNLYVSDTGNQRIRYIDLAAGTVRTVAGGGSYETNALYVEGFYVNGKAADARFYSPRGIALDAKGGLYIADSLNHSIRYLKDGFVTTVAGSLGGENGNGNGVENTARLDLPTDVALAGDGSLYAADTYNNQVRRIELYALPDGWKANGQVNVIYKNEPISFDAQPTIRSSRTMVPVRAIAEALGYDVSFEGSNIVMKRGETSVTLTIGKLQTVRISGGITTSRQVDASPFIEEERTYVPVRFFAEEIGVDVEWHEPTATVILRDVTIE